MYTIKENNGFLEVQDEQGTYLQADDLKMLADWLVRTAERQPIATLVFVEPKKGKKKQTEEEKRINQRIKELKLLIAGKRGISDKDLAHGVESAAAKKLAQSPEEWTDKQVEGCYDWIRREKSFYRTEPITLAVIHKYIGNYKEYCLAIKARRSEVQNAKQDKVYEIAQDVVHF